MNNIRIALLITLLLLVISQGCTNSLITIPCAKPHLINNGVLSGTGFTPIGVINYRADDVIKQIWSIFVSMLQCWWWDLLLVTLLIAVLTEVLGNTYLKALSKMLVSIVVGGIIGLGYKLLLGAGWWYVSTLIVICIILANFGWEYLQNKLNLGGVATTLYKGVKNGLKGQKKRK